MAVTHETGVGNPPAAEPATDGIGSRHRAQPTIGQLLSGMALDTRNLVTSELTLAKLEVTGAIDGIKAGAVSLAGGAAVLVAGLGALVAAAILGLATVLAPWLAALIVGVILAVIGAVMLSAGKSRMSASSFTPDRALRAVRRDAETVKRNVR